MTPGLVSIVTPIFNSEKYLPETVESVCAQSYGDWELIIVDDGSEDGSRASIERFLTDRRIRYVRQANAGVSIARNRGFALSSGEFVAFLDADDVWLPDNLSAKVAYLRANPERGLVHAGVEIIDGSSCRTGRIHFGQEGWVLDQHLLWESDVIMSPSNTVVRRSAIENVGGFDPLLSTAADQDFNFRMASRFPVGRLPRVLVLYRVHESNMHQDIALMERDHMRVYEKAASAGLFRDPVFKRRCFANLFLILAGSWWHDGGRKLRGLYFLARSVLSYPPVICKVIGKTLRKPRRTSRVQGAQSVESVTR